MGQQVDCKVKYKGKTSTGKAMLESESLHFRGDFRLDIPLRDVKKADAEGGALKLSFQGGAAVFELGDRAEKWLAKIRNPRGLLDKLGVKPGAEVVVLGVADESFRRQLAERTPNVSEGRLKKGADLIFLRADDKEALGKIKRAQDYMKRDGALWVVAPKGKQHIKEADVFAAGKEAGMVDTKLVKFSETHTAHKLVIPLARR